MKKKLAKITFGLMACSLLLTAFSCRTGETVKTPKKPNILFLLADDQRSTAIHALGNQEIITPNMDRLVKEGTTFKNTYLMGAMNGAVCSPSRAMLMTGRALYNIDPTGNSIDESHQTLPNTLEKAGYHTFHIGKWHNGREAFIRSFGDGSKIFFGGMHSHYDVPTYEFSEDNDYSKSRMNPPSEKHSSELYADAAIDFLKTYDGDAPFFAYVAFQAPHDPREMPQRYLDLYDPSKIPLPENFLSEHPFSNGELDIRDEWLAGYPRTAPEVKANIAAYYAMVTHLDEQIGRILKTLEQKGLMEDTIIVFSADNGLAVGQHGLMGKQNLYEHSIGVPLIFKGPGIPKGDTRDSFAYLYDIYPTLCELAGTGSPASVEGSSLVPAIYDPETQVHNSLFFAYKNFQRAVRHGDWKLIKYNVGDTITTQLFNLGDDPYETTNLAADSRYAPKVAEMTRLLGQEMRSYNDKADLSKKGWGVPVIPAWKDVTNPDEVEHLRKLALKERQMRGFGTERQE